MGTLTTNRDMYFRRNKWKFKFVTIPIFILIALSSLVLLSISNVGCPATTRSRGHNNEELKVSIYSKSLERENVGGGELTNTKWRVSEARRFAQEETGEVEPVIENLNSLRIKLNSQRHMNNGLTSSYPGDLGPYFETFPTVEILNSVRPASEYSVEPYHRFDLKFLYPTGHGLGKRSVENLVGRSKKEIVEVLDESVKVLNKNRSGLHRFTKAHFWDGMYRTIPTVGTHYELVFNLPGDASNVFKTKVSLFRPFGLLVWMPTPNQPEHNIQMIHVLVPVEGRFEKLQKFLYNFANVCAHHDKYVNLTIVLFGENKNLVEVLVTKVTQKYSVSNIHILYLNGAFSRAKAIDAGVNSLGEIDVLLFMCDVDVVFTESFPSRCRLNTAVGEKVYYPIVFSFYNPDLAHTIDHKQDVFRTGMKVKNDIGYWRDFGFGMTCQYKSDYEAIGGFGKTVSDGWGEEDLLLYRKYLENKNYIIIRATDNGLFHTYHKKHCDPSLSDSKYNSCIRSMALNEASHAQLGRLALKDFIDLREAREYRKSKRIGTRH